MPRSLQAIPQRPMGVSNRAKAWVMTPLTVLPRGPSGLGESCYGGRGQGVEGSREEKTAMATKKMDESGVHVALLRGINLGARQIPMKKLAEIFAEAGCRDVKTYIQSGNVVFRAANTSH